MTPLSCLRPLCPVLLLFLGCASQEGQPGKGPAAPSAQGEPAPEARPAWDDPQGVRHIWPQAAALAATRGLCPFVYQRADGPTSSLVASYERDDARSPPFSQ